MSSTKNNQSLHKHFRSCKTCGKPFKTEKKYALRLCNKCKRKRVRDRLKEKKRIGDEKR